MRHSLKKRHPGVAVRYLLMVLVSFLFLFPFYWMMRTSVMPLDDIFEIPIVYFPREIQLEPYAAAFTVFPLMRYLLNSLFITSLATIGAVLTSSLVSPASLGKGARRSSPSSSPACFSPPP